MPRAFGPRLPGLGIFAACLGSRPAPLCEPLQSELDRADGSFEEPLAGAPRLSPAADAVVGPSRSGKSTLVYRTAGLDRQASGQTFVGGIGIGGLDDAGLIQLRRRRVAAVRISPPCRCSLMDQNGLCAYC